MKEKDLKLVPQFILIFFSLYVASPTTYKTAKIKR